MDELVRQLVQEARRLGLDTELHGEQEGELLEFARLVLQELAAYGLIEGESQIGCWAMLRSSAN